MHFAARHGILHSPRLITITHTAIKQLAGLRDPISLKRPLPQPPKEQPLHHATHFPSILAKSRLEQKPIELNYLPV